MSTVSPDVAERSRNADVPAVQRLQEAETSLLAGPHERARRAHARVLQALQEPGTQVAVAAAIGVSESTVSRIKNERIGEVLLFLYALGFKVVDQSKVCVKADELSMLRQSYVRMVQHEDLAQRLFGDDE